MPEYRVYLLSGSRTVAVELVDYELDVVLRHNAPGSWQLTTTLTAEAAAHGQFAGYGSGIMLTRDGETIMVGILEQREIREAGQVTTLTLSGRDALVHLEDRVVDPLDGQGSPDNYSTGPAYSEQAGAAETLLRHYVNVNTLGGGAAHRLVPNFVLSGSGDSGSGGSKTTRERFSNLLELLQRIAATAEPAGVGLRFRVIESFGVSPGRLEFKVETPRDLRTLVTFDRRSASEVVLREAAPSVNAVVIGGDGEGVFQRVLEVTNDASISRFRRRIERYVDLKNESDTAKLKSRASEVLATGDGGFEFEVTPLDDAPYHFGRDYDLGDLVGVEVAGYAGYGIVREVRVQIASAGGVRITPLIGTEGATFTPVAERRQAALSARVSHLERLNRFGPDGIAVLWVKSAAEIPLGYGVCDGSTYNGLVTPDMRGRVPVGVDANHGLAATGGALTANIQHSHSMSHTHDMAHTHVIDHDHGEVTTSAPNNTAAIASGTGNAAAGDHTHQVDLPAFTGASGASSTATTGASSTATTGGAGATALSIEQPWVGVYFIVRIPAA